MSYSINNILNRETASTSSPRVAASPFDANAAVKEIHVYDPSPLAETAKAAQNAAEQAFLYSYDLNQWDDASMNFPSSAAACEDFLADELPAEVEDPLKNMVPGILSLEELERLSSPAEFLQSPIGPSTSPPPYDNEESLYSVLENDPHPPKPTDTEEMQLKRKTPDSAAPSLPSQPNHLGAVSVLAIVLQPVLASVSKNNSEQTESPESILKNLVRQAVPLTKSRGVSKFYREHQIKQRHGISLDTFSRRVRKMDDDLHPFRSIDPSSAKNKRKSPAPTPNAAENSEEILPFDPKNGLPFFPNNFQVKFTGKKRVEPDRSTGPSHNLRRKTLP